MKVSNGGTGGDETVCSLRRGCREKKKKKTTYERRDSSLSHTSQCTYLEADEDRNKPRNGHESRGPSKKKKKSLAISSSTAYVVVSCATFIVQPK